MNNILSFEEIMNRLAPVIRELEETRIALLTDAKKKSAVWGCCIILIAVIISLIATSAPGPGVFFGLLLTILATMIIFNSHSKRLSPKYKKELIGKLIEGIVENGRYEPDSGLSESEFNSTGLFNTPDRYNSEDLISGKIGKTPFCFAEVHAEEKHTTTNSKGQTTTTWVTLFKGFMFIADFNKDFAARTLVHRNSFLNFMMGNRVKLEDPVFEKHFDVFSTDQVEARYILSPAMMERMIKLDEQFDNDLLFSFYQSKVVIMVKCSRDHFESSIRRPVNQTKTLQEEYNTIVSLVSIIEALDLNTRIWSKE